MNIVSKVVKSSKHVVDRKARNRLSNAIESFLADKTTAFQFDEMIFSIASETEDATVNELVMELWHFYDDCVDHHVNIDRQAWGYMQRVLLLLHSDYHLCQERTRIWLPTQIVAGAILALAGYSVLHVGFTFLLVPLLAFYGCITVAIADRRSAMTERYCGPYARILYPFSSFAELAEVRRRYAKFQKQRYQEEIGKRRIRGHLREVFMWVTATIYYCAFSPLLLFFELFPTTHRSTRVVSS